MATLGSPFDALLGMQRALEEAMRSDWMGLGTSSRGAFPPINVFQDEQDSYVLVAELPGVAREQVSIEIDRNQVRLHGEKVIDYGENVSLHRRERQAGRFDRTFAVPFEVDADKAQARFQNGMLALYLPPVEENKPRTIPIQ